MFLIGLLTSLKTYSQIAPLGVIPELIWSSSDGSSGTCTNTNTLACTPIKICLGEEICFSFNYNYGDGGIPWDIFTFSPSYPNLSVPNAASNSAPCAVFTPTAAGSYTITGTVIMPFEVIVLPSAPPTLSVNLSPNNPICAGTPVCIQSLSSPIITYDFSSATDIPYFGAACSTSNTSTFSFPPGNHQILYTVNAGHTCSNTATYSLTVTSMSLSLTAITPTNCSYDYCFNVAPTTCSISSNVNFEWIIFGPSSYSYTTNGTSQSICNTFPAAGTYSIYVYTPYLISYIEQFMTIVVPPLSSTLSISASPSTSVCVGNSTTLTASGVSTYTWNTGPNTPTISVTPTVATTYSVAGTNTMGCVFTKTITINVVSIPTITAVANPSATCVGQASTLTASGATNYTWSSGATTSSTSVTPTVTTTYTVTGNTSGCSSTQTVTVNINKGQYCCQSAVFAIGSATASNTNYSNTSNGSGSVIDVLGTITFTANSTMINYVIRMAPTATININSGVTVTFINCTIFSCTDLWGGISIIDGIGVPGRVNVTGCRIEDMYMGIVHSGFTSSSTGAADFINVTNSIFNNNYISIQLRNYPQENGTALREGLSVRGSTITSQYSATSPQNTLKSSTIYTYAYNNINNTSVPYTFFPRGIVGIYLYNLEEIPVVIGDSTGNGGTNRFENLDFGIYAENASVLAYNNHFINIAGGVKQNPSIAFPPPPLPPGPDEIGIGISAIITNGDGAYRLRIGKIAGTTTPTSGNPFPIGNKFEDCGKGIAITNYVAPFVKGNVFTSTNTSIPPILTPSSLYSYYKAQSGIYVKEIKANATIVNNFILNHSSGIYTSHNINTSYSNLFIKIENNLIEAPGTNGYCRQAIQVDQPLSTTNLGTGLLTVKNNTIQNVYNGIKAFNVRGGLQINSNATINLSAAKTLGVPGINSTQINSYIRTCIYVQSCQDAVVANNPNLTSNGTINSSYYTAVKGIWFNGSTGTTGQVNCNVISNMGRCMQFSSTSLNKVSKNVMNGSGDYQGFVLHNNGQIGLQGSTSLTNDNEWNGFTGGSAQYAETYSESSSTNANTNSQFYVKLGSPYQPTQNYSSVSGNEYQTGPLLGIRVLSSGTPGETCLALRMIGDDDNSNTYNGNDAMRSATDNGDTTSIDIFEALASDTTFYDVYQNETQYLNKQLVYELINTQSIDTTQTLGNFYGDNQKSNYQTIININDAFANADYQTVQTINSNLTANNTIEEYQKRINELLIKYINYQSQPVDSNATPFTYKAPVFDGIELAELSTIANSCFDKFGSVITQARVLMNNVSNTLIEFEENCKPEFNQRKAVTTSNKLSSTIWAVISPNPNNGAMRLDYNLGGYAKAEFKLYDIAGKLVTNYSLQTTEGNIDINEENLNNGIYFYHILVGEKTIKTDKIVIIK